MEIEIKEVDFATILPIWRDQLWPGRDSVIEPVSCISVEGKIDMNIQKYSAKFFAAYVENEIVGVISCHKVTEEIMRMRGIYVFPQFRGKRVGTTLINQVKIEVRKQGAKGAFTMAREANQKYYRLNGFRPYKKIDGFEFGPHIIMIIS